jgi:hypothetical protein
MWYLSSRARQVVTASHSRKIRATAFGASIGMLSGLPVSGGQVTVDAGSQVRRTASVVIADPTLWPADPRDILAPYGTELLLEYGIVIPGYGTEWVPLIRGVITDTGRQRPHRSGQGPITISLADRSLRVAEDRLDAPTQTVSGALATAEIRRFIQGTLGVGVTVADRTGSAQVAPVMEIERERWRDGVEKLADSIGAECFADPQGTFVIRTQPQITDAPAWEIRSGRGGTLVSKRESLTRERVYNRVIATGQRTDGTPPVRSVVTDTDPLSPTRWDGAFGRKSRYYSSPLLTTTGQCTTAATAILARARGLAAQVALESIVNPALDAGDVIRVHDQGRWQEHIIDTVTIPLSLGEAQSISTRSVDLEPES